MNLFNAAFKKNQSGEAAFILQLKTKGYYNYIYSLINALKSLIMFNIFDISDPNSTVDDLILEWIENFLNNLIYYTQPEMN